MFSLNKREDIHRGAVRHHRTSFSSSTSSGTDNSFNNRGHNMPIGVADVYDENQYGVYKGKTYTTIANN